MIGGQEKSNESIRIDIGRPKKKHIVIIMYKKHYILVQTRKEKYAFACNYACMQFNFNVLFIKCYVLFSFSNIFQMLKAH
jgi:hypothetical protein